MEPDKATKKQIYEIYKLVYSSNFPKRKKHNLLRSAFSYEQWGWRVVGISKNAVIEYQKAGFRKPSGKLERHHHSQRFADITNLMLCDSLLSLDDWWSLFWDNDETILVTKDEHRSNKYSSILPIDPTEGLFANQDIGWKYGQREKHFLINLIAEHQL